MSPQAEPDEEPEQVSNWNEEDTARLDRLRKENRPDFQLPPLV